MYLITVTTKGMFWLAWLTWNSSSSLSPTLLLHPLTQLLKTWESFLTCSSLPILLIWLLKYTSSLFTLSPELPPWTFQHRLSPLPPLSFSPTPVHSPHSIQCSFKNPAMAFHCLNILPWIPNLPPYSMLQSNSDWPAVLGIFSALPVAGCPKINLDGSSWISLPSTPASP